MFVNVCMLAAEIISGLYNGSLRSDFLRTEVECKNVACVVLKWSFYNKMVVIVFGLPGSGKSYFASRLAKKLEADYISSDQVRKKLFTRPDYSEEGKKQVYKKLV